MAKLGEISLVYAGSPQAAIASSTRNSFDFNDYRMTTRNNMPLLNFAEIMQQVTSHQEEEFKYVLPGLRPSRFPVCSILEMVRMIGLKRNKKLLHTSNFSSDYYMSVGTTVHLIFQKWLSRRTENALFGNWACRNSKCSEFNKVVEHTTFSTCKKCSIIMEYIEVEVTYKIKGYPTGITGHIDGIIETKNGKEISYHVLDFKTTSSNKITRKQLPDRHHIMQLGSYAYVLWKKYKFNVASYSLIYVARDNPNYFFQYEVPFNVVAQQEAKQVLHTEIKKYQAAIDSFESNDATQAIALKPCQNLAQYHQVMGEYANCPFVNNCFNEKKLQSALLEVADMQMPKIKK